MYGIRLCKILLFCVLISTCSGSCKFRLPSPTCLFTSALPVTEECSNDFCMPAIGNGYVGSFIMSDTIHVAGVYNGKANVEPSRTLKKRSFYHNHTHRARLPSTVAINFTVNLEGERTFALDIEQAIFYQWFSSANTDIEQRIYAHRSIKNAMINEFSIRSIEDFRLFLKVNRGNESTDIDFHAVRINDSLPYKAIVGLTREAENVNATRVKLAQIWTNIPDYVDVKKSSELQDIRFVSVIMTDIETNNPISDAVKIWKYVQTSNQILDKHIRDWSSLWKQGNISVIDNLYLSQVIYSSFYNILSSLRHDWLYGLSPGSLAGGEEYLGHVFWDQDTWMFPPILIFYPNLSKTLLQYRAMRLSSAQLIAKQFGYKGAMFPWESAISGLEVCPSEVYGRNEIHITGDISFAVYQYFLSTGDLNWISDFGFDIIYKSAEFWTSRAVYNKSKIAYVINNVMPPDEYRYPVNNSYYTNTIAKLTIQLAIKFGRLIKRHIPTNWFDIAETLYIPYDSKLDYHPEYEGFDITRRQVVKQADVILANFPLMIPAKESTVSNDLKYYSEITDPNGPAMTNSMFTIGWLQIGNTEKAENSFRKNFDNVNGIFRIWSEIGFGRGAKNFITAAGGFLQSIIFGYGGIRITSDGLKFALQLPPNSTQLLLNGINYLGNRLKFNISKENEAYLCSVELLQKSPSIPWVLYIMTDRKVKRLLLHLPVMACKGLIISHDSMFSNKD